MTRELKGWHVLAMVLTFFGVTIGVNVLLTTYALSTFSGEDIAKPYQRGLAYNAVLASRRAQAVLKWSASIDVARDGSSGAVVAVTIAGVDGVPRSGLNVEATLRRPTDARFDRTVALEADGHGAYRAIVKDVAVGQWDIVARAHDAQSVAFEAERRVVLK